MVKKVLKRVIYSLLTIVLAWIGYFIVYGNFHKVDDNIYRSAQLFSFNLPFYIQHYKIKSILNLRGGKGHDFYHDEIEISKENGVVHFDYSIDARKLQSKESMEKLLEIIKNAPKPLLIHCKAGADRTSLATALYLYAIKHDKEPQRAFSILYGHFPWLGSRTVEMDKSFEDYVKSHK